MNSEKFIFCLEAVPDADNSTITEVEQNLRQLAFAHQIDSIYKSVDSIEGLHDSLGALLYDDHNFKNYEIIYLVMPGEPNNICLNDYYYSLEEIAEVFEGKLKGKMMHFSNAKILDLEPDEAQYFLDVTGAQSISGYGVHSKISSTHLDNSLFNLCRNDDDVTQIVEDLHQNHYALCKLLDFRLYY